MKLTKILNDSINEAKERKADVPPSKGLSKEKKSQVVKKAISGKDIGKKGKGFEDVAKKAGGGEKGRKIAAAAMWKNIKREGVDGSMSEAFDLDSIKAIATALWLTYKTAWGIKVFNNFKPAIDAIKNAKDDKEKWEIVKLYAKHLINPAANVFKKIGPNPITPADKPDSELENPIDEGINDGDVDEEGAMVKSQLLSIMKYAKQISEMLDDTTQLDAWVQGHISKAEQLMDQVGHFMLGEEEEEKEY